jgi:hypothetical protein
LERRLGLKDFATLCRYHGLYGDPETWSTETYNQALAMVHREAASRESFEAQWQRSGEDFKRKKQH